jgi:hypothetical protein
VFDPRLDGTPSTGRRACGGVGVLGGSEKAARAVCGEERAQAAGGKSVLPGRVAGAVGAPNVGGVVFERGVDGEDRSSQNFLEALVSDPVEAFAAGGREDEIDPVCRV